MKPVGISAKYIQNVAIYIITPKAGARFSYKSSTQGLALLLLAISQEIIDPKRLNVYRSMCRMQKL